MPRHNVIAGYKRGREHRNLQEKAKEKLEREGYRVFDGLNTLAYREIESLAEKKLNFGGKESYPDLIAVKGKELLIIEIKPSTERFVRQLHHYQQAGKAILWLDIDTQDIELRGLQDL